MDQKKSDRPVALITGASREIGIGAAIAMSLADAGWDIATVVFCNERGELWLH